MSVDWNSKHSQNQKLHTTTITRKLLIPLTLVVLVVGFAGGYAYANNFVNNAATYPKPTSYSTTLTASPIVLNGLFINWQGNQIYLNITNTLTTSVNATVTFYFYSGGLSSNPSIASFNTDLTAGNHPAQPYGPIWSPGLTLSSLPVGSVIRVEV